MARGIVVLMALVALAWSVELADQIASVALGVSGVQGCPGGWLDRLGIQPHDVSGLWGILFAPILHCGFAHLLTNTVPFLVLGFLVMLRGLGTFTVVSLLVMGLGGFAVWLLAPSNTIHIGASGLIFGYLGYLLARGYFERNFASLAIALLVAVLYGGALWGLLPLQRGISWQGHLFGFLAGIVAAGLLRSRPARQTGVLAR
jgi:membrane associated rhomboid family serine protease